MSTNLNYKQVANVKRRTWDVDAYEQKAKEREKAQQEAEANEANPHAHKKKGRPEEPAPKRFKSGDAAALEDGNDKVEFKPADPGRAGPTGSQRAFLQPRQGKVDIDSKIGATEMISAEAAAQTSLNDEEGGGSVKDGITKKGVGWHCSVCDCFLKDSMTYLDHINGRKHQRKLGYSMRVERSTKDQMLGRLSQLAKEKERANKKDETAIMVETNYQEIVKEKDVDEARKKEERAKRRKEKKLKKQNRVVVETQPEETNEEGAGDGGDDDDDEEPEAAMDPALAAMMGFSNFGGGK